MSKKKPYASVHVKDVDLAHWQAELAGRSEVWAGSDVAKSFLKVVLCWGPRCFSRPWHVAYTGELGLLVAHLRELAVGRELVVALEPTGTYSDPLRYALTQAGLAVQRIDCKASHDFAEVFDGVPSQHDGKDAAMLAELAQYGHGTPWPWAACGEWVSTVRHLVEVAEDQQRSVAAWTGRLESLLARHWPEVLGLLGLDSRALLRALATYGDPATLAATAGAAAQLRSWGGRWLPAAKVAAVLASAAATQGVPADAVERQRLQAYAAHVLAARQELAATRRKLARFVGREPGRPQRPPATRRPRHGAARVVGQGPAIRPPGRVTPRGRWCRGPRSV
jgi:transposase